MRRLVRASVRWISALALLVLVASCMSSQLPEYRQSLFDGINQTNARTLLLFATVSGGSSPSQFPPVRQQYDQAIAAFDAIRIQVTARGWPSASFLNRGTLEALCPGEAEGEPCASASEEALLNIADNLTTLRDRHRSGGLAASFVAARKARYENMIGVVLAIENALRP